MKIQEQLVGSDEMTYGGTSACSTITVHETANTSAGADAQAHANLQSGGNLRTASWHLQVDDHQAIRSFPDEAQCWHAGAEAKHSIAIEMCVNSDGDYDQTLRNAADVVAQLLAEHDLDEMNVVGHVFWTGKHCPAQMLSAERWDEFIADVRARLNGKDEGDGSDSIVSGDGSSSSGGSKTPRDPDKGRWPEAYLTVRGDRNQYWDRAWRDLMDRIGHDGNRFTRSLQTWLRGLGYNVGPSDGDFGERTTRALQRFLKDKGHYDGQIDGDRGELTIRAEHLYLNRQAEIIVNL